MNQLQALALRLEVQDFLHREAELVDERRFEDWLALFADDLIYRMPMVRNLAAKSVEKDYLEDPLAVAWLDEGKETLSTRVAQIRTGVHWAEEPLSRTAHVVSNIRVVGIDGLPPEPAEIAVKSKILVYRNRNADEEDMLIARREDGLRRHNGSWLISRRTIYLTQSVLLARNLSFLV